MTNKEKIQTSIAVILILGFASLVVNAFMNTERRAEITVTSYKIYQTNAKQYIEFTQPLANVKETLLYDGNQTGHGYNATLEVSIRSEKPTTVINIKN